MRRKCWRATLATRLALVGGCGGETSADDTVNEPATVAQTSTTQSATTTSPPTTETEEADVTEPTPTEQISDCVRFTDFVTDAERDAWQTVNDNVMGGRSAGGPSFGDGLMVFSGDTNTDGGGFSSVRLALEPDALSEFERVVVRAKSDGRQYMIMFLDSQRAVAEYLNAGDVIEASIRTDDSAIDLGTQRNRIVEG